MNHKLVFVAGATGMVGRALVENLTSIGYSNLLTPSSNEVDLRNYDEVLDYFEKNKPNIIVLAAAKVGGIREQVEKTVDYLQDNLLIEINVIRVAHIFRVEKLIFVASANIYPINSSIPIGEGNLLSGAFDKSTESYSLAKVVGIKLIEAYRKQFGDNFFSLVPCNLYGEHDSFDSIKAHVLPALISRIHQANVNNLSEIILWGSGDSTREFLYVRDFAKILTYFIENDMAETYINIGSGEEYSIRNLAKIIANIIGYIGEIKFDHNNPDGFKRKSLDISNQFKYKLYPETDLKTGIKKTYLWYLNHQRDSRKEL